MSAEHLVARVTIEEYLSSEGELMHSTNASDAAGNRLPLVQSLGMLRLAEDSLLFESKGEQ